MYLVEEGCERLWIPTLDARGMATVEQAYLAIKHPSTHKPDPKVRRVATEPHHFIWKGEWERDTPAGGLRYIDEQKMA
jgi:hypothetical protein